MSRALFNCFLFWGGGRRREGKGGGGVGKGGKGTGGGSLNERVMVGKAP